MKNQHAFTLVELSIVLVILGLLIGGVLTGQSLIRAAELRSITTQYQRYITATMTFRDKYFALPGDMTNATSYWGIAGGTGSDATCAGTASTDAKTCNGDGNGYLQAITGSYEYYRYWQHLANAGLIEGSYDGTTHGTGGYNNANSPAGRISGSFWVLSPASTGNTTGNASLFDGVLGNYVQFGGAYVGSSPSALLKPEEAYNIDMKTDDGIPGTGRVNIRDIGGHSGSNCSTAASSSNLSAPYNLANTAMNCVLLYPQAF